LTQIDFGIYDEILNSKIMEEEAFDLKWRIKRTELIVIA
jgi:hypothetical protein